MNERIEMQTKKDDGITGLIWLGDTEDPTDGPVVLEGADAEFAVERSDNDEVSIHATLPGDSNALVSLYMTRFQATYLAALLIRKASA